MFRRRLAWLLGAFLLFCGLEVAVLDAAEPVVRRSFDVPAGPAAQTLKRAARQGGIEIVFFAETVRDVRTPALRGSFTPQEAIERLLASTDLFVVPHDGSDILIIRRAEPPAPPEARDRRTPQSTLFPEDSARAVSSNDSMRVGDTSPNANPTRMRKTSTLERAFGALALMLAPQVFGQSNTSNVPPENDKDTITLSPFEVSATNDTGYAATSTLAGTRLRTELRDIGTPISVLTAEFLADLGATDNMGALSYALNTEVGGVTGNFQNAPNTGSWGQTAETESHFSPNTNTRVRGLVSADNTLNYFRTNVAWDSYNVSRIDLLRGPNSILFGLGSPGGVINASTDAPHLQRNSGEVRVTTDEFGTFRSSLNYNRAISRGQLAVRVALLHEKEKFKQEPAYDDEDRYFISTRYKPRFLNRNGVSFELTADVERGLGTANRPRTAPPLDYITGWIQPVSTQPIQLPAGTNFMGFPNGLIPAFTQFANKGGVSFLQNIGRVFPNGVSTWADSFGPRLYVNSAGGTPDFWRQGRVWVEGVRNPNGTTYFGDPQASRRLFGYGSGFQDTPLQAFNAYLVAQGHPMGNAFIPPQVSDPSVFDFHNRLIDGPNKEEWNDFNQYRVVLSNTFFRQRLGYEVSYFSEDVTRGQTTFLSDVTRIFIDNQTEDIEGRPNPNFGRPYVQESTFGGNRIRRSEIEGFRASAFADYDFRSEGKKSWWRSLVGRQVLNGAYTQDRAFSNTLNFQRHVLGPEFVAASPNNPLYNNRTRVNVRYYLGDSLANASTVSGANIANMDRYVIPPGGTINLRYFDTNWNAPASVSPSAAWRNPLGQNWEQAANPANYVGWRNGNYSLVDALSGQPGDLERATRGGTLQENRVKSNIFTWQGYMFDGLIVGTYGWREDESNSASYIAQSWPVPYNSANLSPEAYRLGNPATVRDQLKVQSNSYSGVLHLNRIPRFGRRLPLNVSLSYNQGENFNPTSGRRDVNGNFMPPPQGSTKEYGIMLSTLDNKYSMRVMRYETAVLNAGSVAIPSNFRFNQFLALNPRNMINDIETGQLRANYDALVNKPSWSIDYQETVAAPAWRKFERDFAAAFPGFVSSWLRTGSYAPMDREADFVTSFVNTEDNVSKGVEVEFTANPTSSLRLTLNASKTNAERTNVPGASTRSIYEFIQRAMYNADGTPTAAGSMRSGYDWINDTMAGFWRTENFVQYGVVQQLNGQPAPELVEYRVNGVANYTFRRGRLNGFGIGTAVRYESESSIGFPYFFDANGTMTADIQNAFKRPANDRYDLWFSYRKKLFRDTIDWSLQLNFYNVLGDDELIPVRANPDGTIANFRIQQGRSWRLTSSFRF